MARFQFHNTRLITLYTLISTEFSTLHKLRSINGQTNTMLPQRTSNETHNIRANFVSKVSFNTLGIRCFEMCVCGNTSLPKTLFQRQLFQQLNAKCGKAFFNLSASNLLNFVRCISFFSKFRFEFARHFNLAHKLVFSGNFVLSFITNLG